MMAVQRLPLHPRLYQQSERVSCANFAVVPAGYGVGSLFGCLSRRDTTYSSQPRRLATLLLITTNYRQAESSTPPLRDLSQAVKQKISTITPHENIYTVPNFLTVSRLLATPVIGYLVLHDQHVWAAGLFAYAGISDLIDGWIARKWKLQTVVGSVIDPMADKFLMTVLVGCLAAKGALPRK
jgi:cardiolipin synthase (CMP-forming)